MRWKEIQEDMVGSVPAGLEQELDRGHEAALKGPNFPYASPTKGESKCFDLLETMGCVPAPQSCFRNLH